MSIEDFLDRLEGVRRCADGWVARCPSHEDSNPSLSVTAKDGKVLLHCHAGCETSSIVSALGLKMSDLMPEPSRPKIVAEYVYADAYGKPRYASVRYEPKDFRQYHFNETGAKVWNMKDVVRVPYRLPELIRAVEEGETIWIVEGEKDVESLRKIGLAATCNVGGAGKWLDEYSSYLKGARRVLVVADNDSAAKDYPGQRHAVKIAESLKKIGVLADVVVMPDGSKDASDFIKAGHGSDDFRKLADNPPPFVPPWESTFSNYSVVVENKKDEFVPKHIDEIVRNLLDANGDFPRKIGSQLFYVDGGNIQLMPRRESLFAFIQGAFSGVDWYGGRGFVSKDEFFERLHHKCRKYDGISSAPHLPPREDVFYTHGQLPDPSEDHGTFWQLIDFFNPADEANKTLIAALMCAPMFFDGVNDRPGFIVDTVDAQGSGKTAVVKMLAYLYGEEPITIDMASVGRDSAPTIKRILSADGRRKRIVLFDNLTRTFKSDLIASLITARTISGLAPYGRGEETRRNDLTFCATVNGATMDTDMSVRFYVIKIRKPEQYNPHWQANVEKFIDEHRLQIFADIRDMMLNAKERIRHDSRFAAFDSRVLSGVCRTDAEYEAADVALSTIAKDCNADRDLAEEFRQMLDTNLKSMFNYATDNPVVIRQIDVDRLIEVYGGNLKGIRSKKIREFIHLGFLPTFSNVFRALPDRPGFDRSAAFFYGTDRDGYEFQFVEYKAGKLEITGVADVGRISR